MIHLIGKGGKDSEGIFSYSIIQLVFHVPLSVAALAGLQSVTAHRIKVTECVHKFYIIYIKIFIYII